MKHRQPRPPFKGLHDRAAEEMAKSGHSLMPVTGARLFEVPDVLKQGPLNGFRVIKPTTFTPRYMVWLYVGTAAYCAYSLPECKAETEAHRAAQALLDLENVRNSK